MDGRQQYIPGPPPSSQTHPMNLPPPPPRQVVPPPPPGPPPGSTYTPATAYGVPTGWQQQQNWGRQALTPGFPPPPPPPLAGPAQNHHLTYGRPPAPLSIIPPRPPNESQPLTSATYIPGNDTIGVGIPGLFDTHGRAQYDPYSHSATAERQRLGMNQPHELINTQAPYKLDPSLPQLRGLALLPNLSVFTAGEIVKSSSHRHNPSGASLGGLSHSEAAIQWPLERVLIWLARNGFSNDWQETFKSLELQGADFLELGHGSGGRGNLGKMHQVVYPQLAKECGRNGTKWDPGRERDEGKRMRKLIRQIHDGSQDTVSTPLQPTQPNAFPDSSLGCLSNHFPEPRSAGPIAGTNDVSPEHLTALQAANQNQKLAGQRSVTMPVPAAHDSPRYDSPARESPTWLRSDYSRNALAGIGEHRRQSPSIGSESGTTHGGALRPHEGSPKSGSPALPHVTPAYTQHPTSSTGDLSLKYDHSRGNSTDSIPGVGRGSTARYYGRQGQEGARPSPQDAYSRQWSGDTPSSYKDHSKGFLGFLKKKTRPNDSSHPSPEQQQDDSSPTTSPETRPYGAYLPYSKPGYNSSDLSVGERPTTGTTKTKKWAFVTMDGLNFRLVDISDMEPVENLRAEICRNMAISDWTSAQIFLTEPGQTEHENPLSDANLTHSRRSKSDQYGSLKLFVRGNPIHPPTTPRVDGLGVSFADKQSLSPTATHHQVHRKPLDEDALNRISPHHAMPSSPSFASRQTTIKAPVKTSPAEPAPDPNQGLDSEKADLLARHEEHLREVERKQKQYFLSKAPLSQQKANAYGDTGYRRNEVIDFDSPRISPYDEKKGESLVPLRKPPMAPIESNTLTKVNSLSRRPSEVSYLSRRPSERPRTRPDVQPHGLGAAIASVGRITSAIGTPLPSVAPSSPTNRDSVGSESDRPGTLDSAGTVSSKTTLDSRPSSSRNSQPEVSFANQPSEKADIDGPSRPTLQSRKSFGPEFDFEENQVSFQRTPQPEEDSDDDSDDGLFQVRPSRTQEEQETEPEPDRKSERPSLTLKTGDRLSKGLSVRFKSPSTAGPSSGDASDGKEPSSATAYEPVSPEDERLPRRDSFARDVWASRPAVEGVIDKLDDFFPDVDLDAPYLDEPPSPTPKVTNTEHDASLNEKKETSQPIPHPTPLSNNPYGSDAATVRPPDASIVARRNIARGGGGGGLSRMKSIRQVAQGANRTKSVSAAGPQKSGDLLRRKSTKMFGAKIMQIRPRPGSRISQLDPIPQNSNQVTSNAGSVPQRQPTFRIIRGQLIGKGTYGRVYLGMNADNGEVLAVKLVEINPRIAGTDKDKVKEMVAALDQEIDTMQHLEHPNIVQYLGCERGEFSISIYLEYISEDVSLNISPAALAFMYDCFTIDSAERPTAGTLLTRHPFCESDPNYNFLDTALYAKIRV
ncbi:uncharacterized protein N7446_008165 [Penicillium canescens]|uniref:uncharacterized protein n=1 Tax=Penicillium canescens TaxID=5083 RepID=UPI0026DFE622|nr:uncharacterized protein N7446_008165 [Penicillium canescens]KAJ6058582.1 hypothetical protein N7446_008165 [Penicillium canescens]